MATSSRHSRRFMSATTLPIRRPFFKLLCRSFASWLGEAFANFSRSPFSASGSLTSPLVSLCLFSDLGETPEKPAQTTGNSRSLRPFLFWRRWGFFTTLSAATYVTQSSEVSSFRPVFPCTTRSFFVVEYETSAVHFEEQPSPTGLLITEVHQRQGRFTVHCFPLA